MPAGFQVFNDALTLQVDQDYKSWAIKTVGQITMVDDMQTHPQKMRVGSVTVTAVNPLMAFGADGHEVNLVNSVNNGNGTWTYHFRSQSNVNYTLSWWCFDQANTAATVTDSYGVEVFNASAERVFHSSMKPMRVVGVIKNTPPTPQLGENGQEISQTINVPAGRTYAVIQGQGCFRFLMKINSYGGTSSGSQQTRDSGEGPPYNASELWRWMTLESWHTAAECGPNTIKAGLMRFESFTGEYPPGTNDVDEVYGDLIHWVVDVTGYGLSLPTSSNDTTPVAMDWTNITGTTTGAELINDTNAQTVQGINVPITLRAQISGRTGTSDMGSLRPVKNGVVQPGTTSQSNGQYCEVLVNQGDTVAWRSTITTLQGIKTSLYTVGVTNQTDNNVLLDTFTVNQTVDSDNNEAPADYTWDAVDWGNVTLSTTGNSGSATNTALTPTGFNRDCTVRAQISGLTSNMTTGSLDFYTNGVLRAQVALAGTNYVDWVVSPGQTVQFGISGTTASGIRTASCTITVTNLTSNNQLDTFTMAATLDSDNNFNNAEDKIPDALNWQDISTSYQSSDGMSNEPNWQFTNTLTISGLSAGTTIHIQAVPQSIGPAGDSCYIYLDCFKNGALQSNPFYSPEDSTTFTQGATVAVANGDTIAWRGVGGGRNATFGEGLISKNKSVVFNVINTSSGNEILDGFTYDASYSDSNLGGGEGPPEIL